MSKYIVQLENDKYSFILQNDLGETLVYSNSFANHISCIEAVQLLKLNSRNPDKFYRKITIEGHFYFVVYGHKEEIVATSNVFESITENEYKLAEVQHIGRGARILDKTFLVKPFHTNM